MVNIRRFWFLGVFLLFSCAGVKEWDQYAKYQEDKGFNKASYEEKVGKERMKELSGKKVKKESLYEKEVQEKMVQLLRTPPTPVKVPDTILRVLVLPWVDSEGNLHAQRYLFVKVSEGRWIMGDYLIKEGSPIKTFTPLEGKDEGSGVEEASGKGKGN